MSKISFFNFDLESEIEIPLKVKAINFKFKVVTFQSKCSDQYSIEQIINQHQTNIRAVNEEKLKQSGAELGQAQLKL